MDIFIVTFRLLEQIKMGNKEQKESPISLVTRLATKAGPWNKKSLGLAIYWSKLLISIILGIIVGFVGIAGALGNLLYLSVPFLMQFYVSGALNIDIEEMFGNASAVALEGMLPCYATYLLIWTLIHTALSK